MPFALSNTFVSDAQVHKIRRNWCRGSSLTPYCSFYFRDFVISSEQVTQPAASILWVSMFFILCTQQSLLNFRDIAGISEDQIKAESRQKSLNGKSDSTMTNAGDSSDLAYDTDPAFM